MLKLTWFVPIASPFILNSAYFLPCMQWGSCACWSPASGLKGSIWELPYVPRSQAGWGAFSSLECENFLHCWMLPQSFTVSEQYPPMMCMWLDWTEHGPSMGDAPSISPCAQPARGGCDGCWAQQGRVAKCQWYPAWQLSSLPLAWGQEDIYLWGGDQSLWWPGAGPRKADTNPPGHAQHQEDF